MLGGANLSVILGHGRTFVMAPASKLAGSKIMCHVAWTDQRIVAWGELVTVG
jgi:hypothetical protein